MLLDPLPFPCFQSSDSVYKQKYDYLKKETELAKTKLKQEHEEELESLASAKKAVERKVSHVDAVSVKFNDFLFWGLFSGRCLSPDVDDKKENICKVSGKICLM